MEEVNRLIESLHPLERTVLPSIKDHRTVKELIALTKLQEIEVMNAVQWLEQKKLVLLRSSSKHIIDLDRNGITYLVAGLPEKRFLSKLTKPLTLEEVQNWADLNRDEFGVSLGILKKKGAIDVKEKIFITDKGKIIAKDTRYEDFLRKLPKEINELSTDEKNCYDELRSRKEIIKTKEEKTVHVELTELGKTIQQHATKEVYLEAVTPQLLSTKQWQGKKFRRYNLQAPVQPFYPGKRHFVAQAIRYIKRIWLEMGFKEMKGSLIEPSFWNFDALFTPQDHPARELQDTFFVKGQGTLPNQKIVEAVKAVHENGGNTGSKGWRYKWSEAAARKLVLRTHTTGSASARTLAQLKPEDLPAKYFTVGKVFRNEALDWKHSFEFHQVDGIVVDENANFQHLLGYLKEYYKKLGFDKIRFRPHYFPYTEMSVEVDIFHPERKEWIELGGAGMFRSEVVVPLLGKDVPVLAWGQGMERSIMDYYAIKDFREIYGNDLAILREKKMWLK